MSVESDKARPCMDGWSVDKRHFCVEFMSQTTVVNLTILVVSCVLTN